MNSCKWGSWRLLRTRVVLLNIFSFSGWLSAQLWIIMDRHLWWKYNDKSAAVCFSLCVFPLWGWEYNYSVCEILQLYIFPFKASLTCNVCYFSSDVTGQNLKCQCLVNYSLTQCSVCISFVYSGQDPPTQTGRAVWLTSEVMWLFLVIRQRKLIKHRLCDDECLVFVHTVKTLNICHRFDVMKLKLCPVTRSSSEVFRKCF